jgi:hypothetical protein
MLEMEEKKKKNKPLTEFQKEEKALKEGTLNNA